MKRILFILIILAAIGYWQWPAISDWWDQWRTDRAAEELTDDELDPEFQALEDELNDVLSDSEAELDALEAGE